MVAVDGSITGQFNASTGSVALVVVQNADEVLVTVQIAGTATVNSVTSDKITFQRRAQKANGTALVLEAWYGGFPSHGTLNIKVNLSASARFTVEAIGISALPGGTVWDANATIPKSATGSSTAPNSGTASTTSTVDLLFATTAAVSGATQSMTGNNVFGSAAGNFFQNNTGVTASDVWGGLQERVSVAAQTLQASANVLGLSAAWVIIEDAIHGYTATPIPSSASRQTLKPESAVPIPVGRRHNVDLKTGRRRALRPDWTA